MVAYAGDETASHGGFSTEYRLGWSPKGSGGAVRGTRDWHTHLPPRVLGRERSRHGGESPASFSFLACMLGVSSPFADGLVTHAYFEAFVNEAQR